MGHNETAGGSGKAAAINFTPRLLCGMAAASMLAMVAGCGKDRSASRETDTGLIREAQVIHTPSEPVYTETYSQPVSQPTYAPPPAVASSSGGLRGPRSQAEIDALYRIPEPKPLPRIEPRAASLPPSPVEADNSGSIGADPSWEVNISREWRHIVVHHSASANGSAAAFDKAHRARGWDGLGYHFVIGNGSGSGDGEVEVGYRWKKQMQGAHAGNAEYNQAGIGICLVGDFENGAPPSPAQMAALRGLVRFLQVKTGVPTDEVVGHQNVPNKSTECPGKQLSMSSFRASLGGGAIGVPISVAGKSGGARKTSVRSSTIPRGGSL